MRRLLNAVYLFFRHDMSWRHWRRTIPMAWMMAESKACDGWCNGNLLVADLCPISGDAWLCDKCLERYFEEVVPHTKEVASA